MRLGGTPLTLAAYRADSRTNGNFAAADLASLDVVYLPPALADWIDAEPLRTEEFIEDDNRGAIRPEAVATLDGLPFYLSVKGIGSTADPYSGRDLDQAYAAELTRGGIDAPRRSAGASVPRLITGELWLRGSPYGGQGWEHASVALALSERANLTSLNGFRLAPVVKVTFLPAELEERLRRIHWYRTYPGRFVQELRLVPSNIRVFFHSRNTLANDIRRVFELFEIDTGAKAHRFETNFLQSGFATLTLFARTLRQDAARGRYAGLEYHDVWIDKDAVLAPDGGLYFVDLEGILEVDVGRDGVREKIEDQVYRSLYEMMFAYEQIDQERQRRFGAAGGRKHRFRELVRESLRDDPFLRLTDGARGLELQIRNACNEEDLYVRFGLVDP
jgi:hypothetical protein